MHRLDNAAWGFDSRCFVCEPSNPRGLGLAYYHDVEADLVRAEVSLGPECSGAPRYVHGGLVYTVLDEAMAWAAIALARRFALVGRSTVRFEAGVRVGELHRVTAGLGEGSRRLLSGWAEIADGDGRRCARAEAKMVVLSAATATAAIGEVEGPDRRFLGPSTAGRGER